ncbi:MAG: 2-deoxy-5-keto-D-gluconate 6-phosphate aldolase domain-containing protein [Janthinobacterium lividum]
MPSGYDKPLYLLPFDHRNSYVTEMFHLKLPLDDAQQARVEDSKQLIYEGFLAALAKDVPTASAGVLVDEEFGKKILRDAHQHGYATALSVERSGSDEFQFEYGEQFVEHIEAFDPTFVKVLVRYNPEGDAAMNQRQAERLKKVSDYCRRADRLMMFELLVPATDAQLASVAGNKDSYDATLRPRLMLGAIAALQAAGVEPAVWKIEGLDSTDDCRRVVQQVRRDGREHVSCIVLGRGADEQKVIGWLATAAQVEGFIGFAVGRTSFFDAVADFEAGKVTRVEAADRIAKRFATWAAIFEQGRTARA